MTSPQVSSWEASGEYITYGPFQHTVFVKQLGNPKAPSDKTVLLIHGFPESSYSYHGIVDGLLQHFERVIVFDLLGFGFSDKPTTGYTYSLFEQTDLVFAVWKHFKIKGGHILSHDMGDSIATEIVTRHENKLLPSWFSEGIHSVTFTNGGMVLELASLRFTQKLLLSRYRHVLSKMSSFGLFKQQIRSAHGNQNLPIEEIQSLWYLNTKQNGHKKVHQTIRYLNDRKRFEKTRWLPALQQTQLPIHICWGDEDAVANLAIAHYLKDEICPQAILTIMKGLGHFCQLENPKKWIEYILPFYNKE